MTTQDLPQVVKRLTAGQSVLLTGTLYTARDAAHKRIFGLIEKGKPLPFPLKNAVIYYAGPTPAPGNLPIGSCGPTTSGRMDVYTPKLIEMGLIAMVGKGERSEQVNDAIVKNGAVYLCAIGGAGALAARCVKSCEVIAFDDLGCESVKCIKVVDFPLIVAVDAFGGNLFKR